MRRVLAQYGVLPSLVDFLNIGKDRTCRGQDAALVDKQAFYLRERTYYVRSKEGSVCVPVEVVPPLSPPPRIGRIVLANEVPDAASRRYSFDELAGGRYLWIHPEASASSVEGEVVAPRAIEGGVRIGTADWYTDEKACRGR